MKTDDICYFLVYLQTRTDLYLLNFPIKMQYPVIPPNILYNPVIPMVIFDIRPPMIFSIPSLARISRIPNPELQIWEIPDLGKPIGDAH